MNFKNQIWKWMFLGILLITGWVYDVLYYQAEDKVVIRPSVPAFTTATASWEYAVLSGNIYSNYWANLKDPAPHLEEWKEKLPVEGWVDWTELSENSALSDLREASHEVGLYWEVWEKQSSSPRLIVVVFRGTDASWKDWFTNLRWPIRWIQRFVPCHSIIADQYTVVAEKFAVAFLDQLAEKKGGKKGTEYKEVQIIATGHSLGGGLAQHFAYALPGTSTGDIKLPPVSQVYAFDPSPVTGWFSIKNKDQRKTNVSSLKIDRVFEHGEFLSYIRLLLGFVSKPPEWVREVRYNFVKSANPFKSHSHRVLACGLMKYGKQEEIHNCR